MHGTSSIGWAGQKREAAVDPRIPDPAAKPESKDVMAPNLPQKTPSPALKTSEEGPKIPAFVCNLELHCL